MDTGRRRRIFYGWWIVLATAVCMTYGGGTWFYGFGAYFNPIIEEFGWSRAVTSFAFALYRLEAGIEAPVVGFLGDRLGPRKLMLGGMVVVGLAWLWLSTINELWAFYAAFVLAAVGFGTAYGPPATIAIANWFVRRCGTAMGLVLAGYGASGLLVPLLTRLIDTYGWRTALVTAAVGLWTICLPLASLIRHRPEPYGWFPDGADGPPQFGEVKVDGGVVVGGLSQVAYTPQEALGTRAFWLMTVAVGLASVTISALAVHEIPYLVSVGLSRELAAFTVTGMTLMSVVGRVGFGFLADRFTKRYLFALCYTLQCCGVLIFANIREPWHVIPFLLVFGPSYGGPVPLRVAMQAEYFGVASFGTIAGVMMFFMMFPGIFGPVFAGWVYDTADSYRAAFYLFAVATAVAVPLIAIAAPPSPQAPAR